MSEMVERIADALLAGKTNKRPMILLAYDVLKAMREPTKEMVRLTRFPRT